MWTPSASCRASVLAIFDFRLSIADIRNSKLEIRNSEKTPLRPSVAEFRFSIFRSDNRQSTIGNRQFQPRTLANGKGCGDEGEEEDQCRYQGKGLSRLIERF